MVSWSLSLPNNKSLFPSYQSRCVYSLIYNVCRCVYVLTRKETTYAQIHNTKAKLLSVKEKISPLHLSTWKKPPKGFKIKPLQQAESCLAQKCFRLKHQNIL